MTDGSWKLFLEDGFEIDEDEILLSSITDNKILIIARSNDFAQGKETYNFLSQALKRKKRLKSLTNMFTNLKID